MSPRTDTERLDWLGWYLLEKAPWSDVREWLVELMLPNEQVQDTLRDAIDQAMDAEEWVG